MVKLHIIEILSPVLKFSQFDPSTSLITRLKLITALINSSGAIVAYPNPILDLSDHVCKGCSAGL